MSADIITNRLLAYRCENVLAQENALKEIAQEIALMVLARAGFFKVAAFQGGTCLRILHGLDRFSEDLDFVLDVSNDGFSWTTYLVQMQEEFSTYGYDLIVKNKDNTDKIIKSAFLKADSTGGILILKDTRTNRPAIHIKLEVDTHPPDGSQCILSYLDFPLNFSIKTQDLPSLFSGKIHALLCRPYTKGRDWYDFSWYVSKMTPVNIFLLKHALDQAGPWKGQLVPVTIDWIVAQLQEKVQSIDWKEAKKDVVRFLRPAALPSLDVWSCDFFLDRIRKMVSGIGA